MICNQAESVAQNTHENHNHIHLGHSVKIDIFTPRSIPFSFRKSLITSTIYFCYLCISENFSSLNFSFTTSYTSTLSISTFKVVFFWIHIYILIGSFDFIRRYWDLCPIPIVHRENDKFPLTTRSFFAKKFSYTDLNLFCSDSVFICILSSIFWNDEDIKKHIFLLIRICFEISIKLEHIQPIHYRSSQG